MSNNKFHFHSKREFLKFMIFFPSRLKNKLQLLLIFKFYHFFLFEKLKIYIYKL